MMSITSLLFNVLAALQLSGNKVWHQKRLRKKTGEGKKVGQNICKYIMNAPFHLIISSTGLFSFLSLNNMIIKIILNAARA